MRAYYNEIDPYAANWLRNLAKQGLITDGTIDERSIADVQPGDVLGFERVHCFAGVAGWEEALRLAGWPEGIPVWTGSCPCQSISGAGKRGGEKDERHLWPEFYRLISECRPPIVLGEQTASGDGPEWLDGISLDLEEIGYAVGSSSLCAASVKAPHPRQRLWWVAYASSAERGGRSKSEWSHWRTLHASDRSGVERLADAGPSPSRNYGAGQSTKASDGEERKSGEGLSGESGRCGGLIGLGQPNVNGLSEGRTAAETVGQGSAIDSAGSFRRFGNASAPRLPLSEQPELSGSQRNEEGRTAQQPGGAWSDFTIIPMLDGKSRRIESGSFPLAHGIPSKANDDRMGYMLARLGEMGVGSKPAKELLRDARANRTGRLRGYGNAIVPEVAAVFIRAVMEAQ